MEKNKGYGNKFEELIEIIDKLRGDNGCSWDKEQDESSISNFFLEEVYEALEALYFGDDNAFKEELGDVIMEIVFFARIFKEKGKFDMSDVLDEINKKMIRRHPHVFGSEDSELSSEQVAEKWMVQKMSERKQISIFDQKKPSMPALLEAFEIGRNASSVGFDWNALSDVIKKVKEEILELEQAVQTKKKWNIFKEIGDVLFSIANVSRFLDINPEIALKQSNKKFIKRFKIVEKRIRKKGKKLGQVSLEEMDKIWEEAKKVE